MRALLAFVILASFVTFVPPVHAQGEPAAPAHCAGAVCDLINRFCHCLGQSSSAAAAPANAPPKAVACMGCDAIIAFCEKHFHTQCVATSGPAPTQCNGDVCDSVDHLCKLYKPGWNCVAIADGPSSAGLQCANQVCQDVDRICAKWGAHCVA